MKVTIYSLQDPDTKEIRYIGRTKNSLKSRLSLHISKSKYSKKPNHRERWILKLLKDNKEPIIEFLEEYEGWSESYKEEQRIINEYINKGYDLVNSHDRGEGGVNRIFTKEHRKKISDKIKLVHEDLTINHNRIPLKMFDLDGNFIMNFRSINDCARYLEISDKHLQCSLKRESKRLGKYQIRKLNEPDPGKYINPRIGKKHKGTIINLINIKTKELLKFESQKEFKEFFNLKSCSTLYYYIDKDRLFRGKFLIKDASLKLDKLLENPK